MKYSRIGRATVLFSLTVSCLAGCVNASAKISPTYWQPASKPWPADVVTVAALALEPGSGGYDPEAPLYVDPSRSTYDSGPRERVGPGTVKNSVRVSKMATEELLRLLQHQITRDGLNITLVDRETLEAQLAERDMTISDIVLSTGELRAEANSLPVDAFLIARSEANIRTRYSWVRFHTLEDSVCMLTSARFVPRSGRRLAEDRNISLESMFRVTLADGSIYAIYRDAQDRTDHNRDKPGPLPGQEAIVRDFVDRQASAFAARLIGGYVTGASITVQSSPSGTCRRAYKYLDAGDWRSVLNCLGSAAEDDSRAMFAAGFAAESLGDDAFDLQDRHAFYQDAQEYYAKGLAHKNDTDCTEGVGRVRGKLGGSEGESRLAEANDPEAGEWRGTEGPRVADGVATGRTFGKRSRGE